MLVKAVRYVDDDMKMPPKGKLPAADVAKLERWVARGAVWPEAKGSAGGKFVISDAQRAFWAFQPVRPTAAPTVTLQGWAKSDVDRFVLRKLEEHGLKPAGAADKRTLLRRATYDLTGLPPTPQEIEAFLADQTPTVAREVDRLLASPAYGEKWGRHWLDVVRYADHRDARGLNGGDDIGEAWRYRDWVINAFNRDLPYNQFIVDQIAGDLVPGHDGESFNAAGLTATGLLTIGEWGTGDADKDKMMTDITSSIRSARRTTTPWRGSFSARTSFRLRGRRRAGRPCCGRRYSVRPTWPSARGTTVG